MSTVLMCFLVLLWGNSAFGNDTVTFTFQDNRQQQIRLLEPKCNIKSITFSSDSPAPGTPPAAAPGRCPINVISAIYGKNCGANYSVDRVARECNGKFTCSGIINNAYAGHDPAINCGKDFTIHYTCCNATKTVYVSGTGGEGGSWALKCP